MSITSLVTALHPDQASNERGTAFVSVIVPVFNEAAHLDELLQAIHAAPVRKEIILVDDGSTDGTREKLQALPPSDDITVVFHDKNYGKGAAIRTALAYARGEYVLIQDSDLEYDPQDYPKLLRPLESGEANAVYGVRPDRPERGLRFFSGRSSSPTSPIFCIAPASTMKPPATRSFAARCWRSFNCDVAALSSVRK